MDDEAADISELHSRVQHFAYSIEALFLSERVLELPTYTKSLCDALERSPVRILHDGQAREFHVTAADKMDALKIMKACRMIASLLFVDVKPIISNPFPFRIHSFKKYLLHGCALFGRNGSKFH